MYVDYTCMYMATYCLCGHIYCPKSMKNCRLASTLTCTHLLTSQSHFFHICFSASHSCSSILSCHHSITHVQHMSFLLSFLRCAKYGQERLTKPFNGKCSNLFCFCITYKIVCIQTCQAIVKYIRP